MKMIPRLASSLVAISVLNFGMREAPAQGDDFEDGDAVGWTELAPLVPLGVAGGTSFPDGNSYRLQSNPSPDEDELGPARIGAIREDVNYSDFYQFVDLVDHDESLDQNIGMLARVTDAGLGTTDGYALTYNPSEQRIYLSLILDEEGNNLADVDVFVPAGEPVRIVFRGVGAELSCEVFSLADLETPLASLEASDPTWATGASGLVVIADMGDPAVPVDCTFDNYFAAAAEPSGTGVTHIAIESDELVFEFLSHPNQTYAILESDDLTAWDEIDDSIPAALDVVTRYRMALPAKLRKFYQFRVVD